MRVLRSERRADRLCLLAPMRYGQGSAIQPTFQPLPLEAGAQQALALSPQSAAVANVAHADCPIVAGLPSVEPAACWFVGTGHPCGLPKPGVLPTVHVEVRTRFDGPSRRPVSGNTANEIATRRVQADHWLSCSWEAAVLLALT